MKITNPIIKTDFPDPDVIRVGDTYYMLSTTMHFKPGAVILRSYDLVHWEILTHVFEVLVDTPRERLVGERCNYGRSMWTGCLRYNEGRFYVCFSAQEEDRTFLYIADDIEGEWEKVEFDGYKHHPSLLFDDDGKVYMVHGFKEVFIQEMAPDAKTFKEDGFSRKVLENTKEDVYLGYEGARIQKIFGKYYLFAMYWPKGEPARRTHLCFMSDSLNGEFEGREVLRDDMGFYNQGIAQGGLVEALNGKWYAVLYQWRGAVGRIPVLVPVTWENDMPVFGRAGKVPEEIEVASSRPYYKYEPVYTSDDFVYPKEEGAHPKLKKQWEWNHCSDKRYWEIARDGGLLLTSSKICTNVTHAVNTLTQRTMWPRCAAEVTVDAYGMKDGDVAGLCALQGCYGYVGITKELGNLYLIVVDRRLDRTRQNDRTADYLPGNLREKIKLTESTVRLRINIEMEEGHNTADFFYQSKNRWKRAGETHRLFFRLDHCMGCRFGLFLYSTENTGGQALFQDFRYMYDE